MSDATPPAAPTAGHAFPPPPPPPPPSERKGIHGCLKYGLIGCGALVVLVVLAGVAGYFWISRNQPALEESARAAVQEGARAGLATDEAGCLEAGASRGGGVASVAEGFSSGSFMRGCLEYSRETPGFCEDVPAPTAIRRTIEWQRERCAGDAACARVISVVQTYCTEGRPKRIAADTLAWEEERGVEVEGVSADDTAAP